MQLRLQRSEIQVFAWKMRGKEEGRGGGDAAEDVLPPTMVIGGCELCVLSHDEKIEISLAESHVYLS